MKLPCSLAVVPQLVPAPSTQRPARHHGPLSPALPHATRLCLTGSRSREQTLAPPNHGPLAPALCPPCPRRHHHLPPSHLPSPTPPSPLVLDGVIDGDTIWVDLDGNFTSDVKVRYLAIDTPEMNANDCYKYEARERNRELVDAQPLALHRDTSDTDPSRPPPPPRLPPQRHLGQRRPRPRGLRQSRPLPTRHRVLRCTLRPPGRWRRRMVRLQLDPVPPISLHSAPAHLTVPSPVRGGG